MTARFDQSTPPPWPPTPPEYPWPPQRPETPERPWPQPQRPIPSPSPARGDWPARLYDRLLEQRIVMAHGRLDDEAATRLSAQLLTLDAENMQPIRLELQGLDAELPAALTLMGVLDVVRAPVSAYVGGRISGPALGVLAAADHRYTYPSALFILCEPRMQFDGTVTTVASQEEMARVMERELVSRLAAATGRSTDELQADFEHQRVLTAGQAVDYGLVQGPAEPRRPAHAGLQP
jgi:ATP-dependent Clp protease protease subunit